MWGQLGDDLISPWRGKGWRDSEKARREKPQGSTMSSTSIRTGSFLYTRGQEQVLEAKDGEEQGPAAEVLLICWDQVIVWGLSVSGLAVDCVAVHQTIQA
ncbi:hypothetical protein N7468_010737 [Penicillium chermesinum]|uniref:Uncharacterized protein n=1 Tax=Penicillium chermesinum TaxID=63820 RepID=A0A9W9TA02_9EURO|nr:uncharacterized protein N7468_010737 [Penicillium chermesinum]KAJ5215058.1 hypothetical protein N7468_010737 [Penicillium chermesinum]